MFFGRFFAKPREFTLARTGENSDSNFLKVFQLHTADWLDLELLLDSLLFV
jgi:hypothetical protein